MFPTIDDNLICERVLGWNLVDGSRELWRLPDGSTRVGTPRLSTDAELIRAIDAALDEADDDIEVHSIPSAGWFDAAADAKAAASDGDESDWAANYHIECAIARATRRLIERAKKASN